MTLHQVRESTWIPIFLPAANGEGSSVAAWLRCPMMSENLRNTHSSCGSRWRRKQSSSLVALSYDVRESGGIPILPVAADDEGSSVAAC
ncbi:hypothetical protein AVEN_113217-1 [Araneus ventricosus]|uniref:Uncharacterized protein n=1 Tax=Araneus ventricosus TaxID=182803 RepID=A0A4Y2WVL5_ARAVE|nr:hypothetical protein AVEN_113217-1 [Araneus ventricosus]